MSCMQQLVKMAFWWYFAHLLGSSDQHKHADKALPVGRKILQIFHVCTRSGVYVSATTHVYRQKIIDQLHSPLLTSGLEVASK